MLSKRWVGLVFISLGVALIIVDSTIVNVAVPSIINDIGLTSTQAQWVQEIYTLVFAALLLVGGRLADQYGRRRLFLIGTWSSPALACSPRWPATGLADRRPGRPGPRRSDDAADLAVAAQREFPGRDRGVAFGIWGATIGGTAALGPLLGGWLTTTYSWRWAFGINIPLGLLSSWPWLVAESKDPSGSACRRSAHCCRRIGFGGVVFGLIEGRNYGW